jgi:NAD(P)-dependent dehydrogenase (short-subunit alcohol dehydrogenase family)
LKGTLAMQDNSRVALVTGGAAGMGKATSLRLAREGKAVAVLDIDSEGSAAVAAQIVAEGGKAIAVDADVSDRAEVENAVAEIRDALGPITILINNAAIENFCPFPEITSEVWDRLMAVNLKGNYYLIQAVLPDMVNAGWGRIVNLSAIGAQTGAPNMVHYTATKGAVIAMTRSLAVELGPKGITVNSVSPGFIDTPMARRAIDGDLFPVPYEQIIASYPIPRLGQPEDIAAACAFFASEDAGYITGQLLGVNGGAAV